jgi:Uma2 family endonuclease
VEKDLEEVWMAGESKLISYEDYLLLPEMCQPYEIIDGDLHMTPSPTKRHQRLVLRIAMLLESFVSERNLGEVLPAPMDVLIEKHPRLRTRQPDILYLSRQKETSISSDEDNDFIATAPELVVEILSNSESRRRIREKLNDYHRIGIRECWLVSPEAETIEVLDLSGETMTTTALYGINDHLSSKVLPDFSLPVNRIFR